MLKLDKSASESLCNDFVIDWLFENWLMNLERQWAFAMLFWQRNCASLDQVCRLKTKIIIVFESSVIFFSMLRLTKHSLATSYHRVRDIVFEYDLETEQKSSQWKHPSSPKPKKLGKFGQVKRQCWLLFWSWRNKIIQQSLIIHHPYSPDLAPWDVFNFL